MYLLHVQHQDKGEKSTVGGRYRVEEVRGEKARAEHCLQVLTKSKLWRTFRLTLLRTLRCSVELWSVSHAVQDHCPRGHQSRDEQMAESSRKQRRAKSQI